MPLTVPSHPVAVVPLKLWRPRWFDGVALVVGAVAPDLAYALHPVRVHGHAWTAPLWWAAPLALVVVPVARRVAGPVARHLPDLGVLRLRDYGALAGSRHRWWVTASSAALGAWSHILWDSVTHATVDYRPIPWPGLTAPAFDGWVWFEVVSKVSNAVNLVGAVASAVYIGRLRLVRRWHGQPPAGARRHLAFWTTAGTVATAATATLPFLAHPFTPQAVRCLLIGCLALAAAGAVTRGRPSWRWSSRAARRTSTPRRRGPQGT